MHHVVHILLSLTIMNDATKAETAHWFLAERISASGHCPQFAEFFDRDQDAAIDAFGDFCELVPAIELTARNLQGEPDSSECDSYDLWVEDDSLLSLRMLPWLWDNADNLEAFMGARLETYTQDVRDSLLHSRSHLSTMRIVWASLLRYRG